MKCIRISIVFVLLLFIFLIYPSSLVVGKSICDSNADCNSVEKCLRGVCADRNFCLSNNNCGEAAECDTRLEKCFSLDCPAGWEAINHECKRKISPCKTDGDCHLTTFCEKSTGKCLLVGCDDDEIVSNHKCIPKKECESDWECPAEDERCVKEKCESFGCPLGQKIKDHECVKEKIVKCGDGKCSDDEDCEKDNCCSGKYVKLNSDQLNCGKCGKECDSDKNCENGRCIKSRTCEEGWQCNADNKGQNYKGFLDSECEWSFVSLCEDGKCKKFDEPVNKKPDVQRPCGPLCPLVEPVIYEGGNLVYNRVILAFLGWISGMMVWEAVDEHKTSNEYQSPTIPPCSGKWKPQKGEEGSTYKWMEHGGVIGPNGPENWIDVGVSDDISYAQKCIEICNSPSAKKFKQKNPQNDKQRWVSIDNSPSVNVLVIFNELGEIITCYRPNEDAIGKNVKSGEWSPYEK